MDSKLIAALLSTLINKADETDMKGLFEVQPEESERPEETPADERSEMAYELEDDEDKDDKLLKDILKKFC